jgi:DNA-directed RNA polymerase beta subunit
VLDEEITQEDAWVIINKYFETKGLVRQQLDSFDEFLQNSIQELIDDAGEVKIIPEDQFLSDKQVDKVCLPLSHSLSSSSLSHSPLSLSLSTSHSSLR